MALPHARPIWALSEHSAAGKVRALAAAALRDLAHRSSLSCSSWCVILCKWELVTATKPMDRAEIEAKMKGKGCEMYSPPAEYKGPNEAINGRYPRRQIREDEGGVYSADVPSSMASHHGSAAAQMRSSNFSVKNQVKNLKLLHDFLELQNFFSTFSEVFHKAVVPRAAAIMRGAMFPKSPLCIPFSEKFAVRRRPLRPRAWPSALCAREISPQCENLEGPEFSGFRSTKSHPLGLNRFLNLTRGGADGYSISLHPRGA
ncbi:hypothetical protein DFH09DRAFT_1277129 [Mycena vulgaris]|nr:hypothetical protein DFH09DRAFT_1277129 [Mycena vulgaris]